MKVDIPLVNYNERSKIQTHKPLTASWKDIKPHSYTKSSLTNIYIN